MTSKYLQENPQYHFARDKFIDVFREVFSSEELFNLEVACQEHRCVDDFLLYYNEDEFYIIHLVSGTIVNWYKHLGRTNTCNKPLDSIDLFELLTQLKDVLESW